MAPRKEKPKEYGASVLDFQKWFPFSSDPDSMQLRKWEFWESLRRHKGYLELCKEIDFDKNTSLISTKWLIQLENRDKLKRATDRAWELFGVKSITELKPIMGAERRSRGRVYQRPAHWRAPAVNFSVL